MSSTGGGILQIVPTATPTDIATVIREGGFDQVFIPCLSFDSRNDVVRTAFSVCQEMRRNGMEFDLGPVVVSLADLSGDEYARTFDFFERSGIPTVGLHYDEYRMAAEQGEEWKMLVIPTNKSVEEIHNEVLDRADVRCICFICRRWGDRQSVMDAWKRGVKVFQDFPDHYMDEVPIVCIGGVKTDEEKTSLRQFFDEHDVPLTDMVTPEFDRQMDSISQTN